MLSFLSLLLSDCGVQFWASGHGAWAIKTCGVGDSTGWLNICLGQCPIYLPSSSRFQVPAPVCVLCIRNRWPSMLPQEDSPQCLWYSSHDVPYIFYGTKDQQEVGVLYIEVKDLSGKSWHTCGISFSLRSFLFVFLTDVLDLNNLFIFQVNFIIFLRVQINLDGVMKSRVHWAILLCPPFCKYFMNFYSPTYSGS